jgi:sensor domain CHASE-containing protein
MAEIRVVVYLDPEGRSTFTKWINELNAEAAAKVTTALYRPWTEYRRRKARG